MREIKFEYVFKHKRDGCFLREVHTLDFIERSGCHGKDRVSKWFIDDGYEVIAKRQYTGLKDKNGIEIYESDVLDIQEYGKAKVVFIDGAFMAEWIHDDCYSMELSQITWKDRNNKDLFEVIGNIYENPELLGG